MCDWCEDGPFTGTGRVLLCSDCADLFFDMYYHRLELKEW